MKTLLKTIIILFIMTQCQNPSDPSKWSEQQLNDWFKTGVYLNGLTFRPDNSVNRRAFAVHYAAHQEMWDKAFAFLKNSDLSNMPLGRVELGDQMYANIEEYIPREHENTRFEAHRKYIDIQYIIAGKEIIGLTDIKNMTVIESYNAEKDIEFGTAPEFTGLKAVPGIFFLFFPDDAHRPCMRDGNNEEMVRKVVVKVPV